MIKTSISQPYVLQKWLGVGTNSCTSQKFWELCWDCILKSWEFLWQFMQNPTIFRKPDQDHCPILDKAGSHLLLVSSHSLEMNAVSMCLCFKHCIPVKYRSWLNLKAILASTEWKLLDYGNYDKQQFFKKNHNFIFYFVLMSIRRRNMWL